MNKPNKKLKIALLFAIAVLFFGFLLLKGTVTQSKTTDEELSSVKKEELKHQKPDAFIDPIEESVTVDEKKAIYKVLTKLQKKVEEKGLEEIEFPFPPEEEEEEAEAEKKEETAAGAEETEVEAEKEKEKPKFSMYIPTVAEETACVVRTDDGKVQGNFFVYTFYKHQNTTLQIWRLTFEEVEKDGKKEWQIVDKTIIKTKSDLYYSYYLREKIYSFTNFEFSHDRFHVKYGHGYFLTLFAGEKPIGGVLFGKGVMSYYPPRQLAKDVTDSDVEEYQLMRFTGTKEKDKFTSGKTRLENEPFEDGFIFMHPDRFQEYIKTSDFSKVEDKEIQYELMVKTDEIKTSSFDEAFGFKFPGVKEYLWTIPYAKEEEQEFFFCGVNTKNYQWIHYTVEPYFRYYPFSGDGKEIFVENVFDYYLYFTKQEFGNIIGRYDLKEQRETMTRADLEHEHKEIIYFTHETVECRILPEKPTDGEIKDQIYFNVMKDNVDKVHFLLNPRIKISAVTDDDGFAVPFCRGSDWPVWVMPNEIYRIAEERKLTFYTKGQITQQTTLNTFSPGNTRWTPYSGYLQCRTLDLLVQTPQPYKAVSVGALVDEWQEGVYNSSYWKSDECVRLYSIIYAPYEVYTSEIDTSYGPIPLMIYYQTTEELALQYVMPWWVKHAYGTDFSRRGAKRIYRLSLKMANMDRIRNEMDGIMNWLTSLYGPYPYPKIAVTQKSVRSGYAQGFPSMLQMWGSAFFSDKDWERFGYSRYFSWGDYIPDVMCHEAGHQWWGNIVGWARGQDQWLSEGINDQQAPNYMQQRNQNDEILRKRVKGWWNWALKHDRSGPVILGGWRLGSSYFPLTYGKAPYIMNMLRLALGEKAFLTIERQFIRIFGFKRSPTTSDFVEIASRTLGEKNCMALFNEKDINWYFDQWVYNRGIPEFSFAWKKYKDGNTWHAKCRIKVLNDILFKHRGRIWVYLKGEDKPYPVWLLLERKEVQEFDIELKGEPKKITFNEFDSVLCRSVKTEKY